jgi:hypothetical protein
LFVFVAVGSYWNIYVKLGSFKSKDLIVSWFLGLQAAKARVMRLVEGI